jgi:hypothetical protein
MSKTKSLITEAAARAGKSPLVSKAWDRLEKEAERAISSTKGSELEIRIISSGGRTSAQIKAPGLDIVQQGRDVAVRLSDEKEPA